MKLTRTLPLVVGTAVVLVSTAVEGFWTDRWGLANEPRASAANLDRIRAGGIALDLGDWKGEELEPLDRQSLAIGEIAGFLNRRYTNRRTGQALSVLLVCGRPGPIVQHAPTVCFGGIGFELVSPPVHQSLPEANGRTNDFLVGRFHKEEGQTQADLRIRWAWSSNGIWSAPARPRWTFARRSVLYKLYLVQSMTASAGSKDDPAEDLARVLLPALSKEVFSR